ncbi:diguanylate cyclase [Aeromonas sanarellii]|nr:diguanylate cyclase [Aeromonas sanarellii]
MLTFRRTQKNFTFITGYLWLLALPMLLGIGGLFALSVYNHGVVVEQKLASLNGMAVVTEDRMLDHLEQLMSVEVTADLLTPVFSSSEARQVYRERWGNMAALDPLVTLIFHADSNGYFFSGSKEADQAWVNARANVRSRAWFKGALEARTFYWTPAYQDILTGDYILTLAHRLTDGRQQGEQGERVIGIDVNVAQWSKMLRDMLYGDNAVSHMVIDRRTHQILVSSQSANNGQILQAPWLARLTAHSGSFYSDLSNEYVAYGTLPDREHWMAITVQPRRDSVAAMGGGLALGLLVITCALFITMSAFFRLRLLVLIDNLAGRIRRLGAGSREAHPVSVLPAFPEMALLDQELDQVSDHLQESFDLAHRDALTGSYNRRFLDQRLRQLHEEGNSFVLALVDLDNFKQLNDVYGHAGGDAALCRSVELGQTLLGEGVLLCRYGGEELVALFEQHSLAEAERLMELWRCQLSEQKWREKGMRVTFSAGIGASLGRSPEVLIALVDKAMYQAKRAGKNRIHRIEEA